MAGKNVACGIGNHQADGMCLLIIDGLCKSVRCISRIWMILLMRSDVVWLTSGLSFRTRETVVFETPANLAISPIVIMRLPPFETSKSLCVFEAMFSLYRFHFPQESRKRAEISLSDELGTF